MAADSSRFSALAAVDHLSQLLDQDDLTELPIDSIDPDPDQPRRDWDSEFMQEKLQSMASSIRAVGVRQPIMVFAKDGGKFQIISGETRWRGSRLAGKTTIPAIVRKRVDPTLISDEQIIENEVRNDLNPLDLAMAVQKRLGAGASREQLCERYGWSKARMSKVLAILDFPPEVQALARENLFRNYEVLAPLSRMPDEERAGAIEDLRSGSLTATELREGAKRKKKGKARTTRGDANIKALATQLGDHFCARVTIQHNGKKNDGTITIKYTSLDVLDGILERCNFRKDSLQD